ncbi:TlpA disulfide reductase family protein [Prevotella sp. OH937_COT-195]|uniref:TlpA disulfide reductase family protein n=1 Tax=Prevotella sp. OH937_COT-195 TaxID=2491051 RepID=UPI001F39D04C|nr:TlpA disulfide reductase family protein [Prevotella sp. OH937_COT-195]
MKRIAFFIITALVATLAEAQVGKVADSAVTEVNKTNLSRTWQNRYDAIEKRVGEIGKQYEAFSKGDADKEKIKQLTDEYYAEIEKLVELAKDVVKDGSDQEMAKKLVGEVGEMVEYEDLLVLMPKEASYYNAPELANLRKRMEMMALRAPGVTYTDLKMQDLNGKERNLSEWCGKGNYVLVDFWASWCRPCREEMPNVVEAYKRHHDKGFDVVGVSFDANKAAWEKAVSDLGMAWHHISDLKGWECAAAPIYGIQSIPSNILVGPDGKIVAADLRAEALLEKLAEIYKD